MCGKREHRSTVAVRIVETLNEVDAAGTATPRAYCKPPGEAGFCGGGKRPRFLIVNVDPFYALGATHGIHYRVEAVPHQTVDALHPGVAQVLY